jgi:hypothetical protein
MPSYRRNVIIYTLQSSVRKQKERMPDFLRVLPLRVKANKERVNS